MMGLHTLVRLRQQQLDAKRKVLAELQSVLTALNGALRDLEAEVAREQETAGSSPEVSFHYGRYANAVIVRRETIEARIAEQAALVAAAHAEVMAAFRELKKLEVVQERREEEARKKAALAEQKSLDEVSLDIHRRRGRN